MTFITTWKTVQTFEFLLIYSTSILLNLTDFRHWEYIRQNRKKAIYPYEASILETK